MDATILWYHNNGASRGILAYDEAVHEEDLDGTDMLTVTTERLPYKRDRLLWQDSAGVWREHMVDATKHTHRNSRPRTVAKCSNSISELFGVRASGTIATAGVQTHLATLLSGTCWTAGVCDIGGAYQLEYWHKNVRQCLAELCDLCGGELETSISVGAYGVSSRTVRIVRQRGSTNAIRQFTYGRNVAGIDRDVTEDEVYTAIIGYGARVDDGSEDDYAPRLTVTATSGADLSLYGVRNSSGTLTHNYDAYTDTECTSAEFLMQQCRKILAAECVPCVRYEFDVPEADSESLWKDVQLGDVVHCVDDEFDPGMELMERVSHIQRHLSGRIACKIAIGKRKNPMVEQFKAQKAVEDVLPTGTSPTTGGAYPNEVGANGTGSGSGIDPSTISGYFPTESDPDADGAATYLPQAISITTQPTDLTYTDGETIDYSGIVVKLLDGNGGTYTSAAYPDGIVPFSELVFPITTAVANEGSDSGIAYHSSALDTGAWTQPIQSMRTYERGHSNAYNRFHFRYGAPADGRLILRQNDASLSQALFASPNSGDSYTEMRWTENMNTGEITSGPYTYRSALSNKYTYGGKTVYYVGYLFYGGENRFADPLIPSGTYPAFSNSLYGPLAWTIIYGDTTLVSDVSIPVQWMRSDGTMLEDTYTITVNEATATEEVSDNGWTDMGDGFSGSGGGSFSSSSSGGGGHSF